MNTNNQTLVRLLDQNGQNLGICSRAEAALMAQENDLTLIMLQADSSPPLMKLVDPGKDQFESKKLARLNKRKSHVSGLKQVKLGSKIAIHDYQMKVRNSRAFLLKGERVKFALFLRGRELLHADLALQLLDRLALDLEEVGIAIKGPVQEGRSLSLILAPLRRRESNHKSGSLAQTTKNEEG